MRILAIDWGKKRLGLAMSDLTGTIASPLPPIVRKSEKEDLAVVKALVEREEVEKIVVGVPLGLAGSGGESADQAEKFAAAIEKHLQIAVERVDERYSTHAAERSLLEGDVSREKRKNLRDGVAAAWFLQGYLDSRAGGAPE